MAKEIVRWSEFIEECDKTILDECKDAHYLTLGLKSELGEIAGKMKKFIRNDMSESDFIDAIKLEIGDCLWYGAMIYKYMVLPNLVHDLLGDTAISTFITVADIVEFPSTQHHLIDEIYHRICSDNASVVTVGKLFFVISHLTLLANSFGFSLHDCTRVVIEKLAARKKIGTIHGDGDGVER